MICVEPPQPSLSLKCPLCQKPAAHAFRPFCSARCKQVDLGRWLTGTYVIPGDEPESAFLSSSELQEETEEAL